MTRLRTLLMATAAIAAMAIGLATPAQATGPALGTTLAPTSTSIIANTGTLDRTLKSTALQDKSFFDTTQFGRTLITVATAGEKKAGDNKKATTVGLWAGIIPDTVGYGVQMQATKFNLKGVAVINTAKHPFTAFYEPRQVRYS